MSTEGTISDLNIDWTSSDDNGEVDNRSSNVDKNVEEPLINVASSDDDRVDNRLVTVEDPSSVVAINVKGMLEQGIVRPMASVVEFPEYVGSSVASTSGRPMNILENSPASVITDNSLSMLRTIYGIPDDVELRAPREDERADWAVAGWTCFYEYTLRLGFRFPIPELVRRTLMYYDLAPGQLMPNTWRILLSISLLCERHNIQFGLGSLLHNYFLKEHVGDPGRYRLVPRRKKKEIVLHTTSNDRHWKNTFFFARGPPVDGPWTAAGEQYQCRQIWNRYGELQV
jgi:hypothetical protein